jgi:hypothetical protein
VSDVRETLRSLFRTPGFALSVIATLGLAAGVGVRAGQERFGQRLPGSTAEPFGGAIVPPGYRIHGTVAFSPDGTEAYWAVLNFGAKPRRAILMSRLENGSWTAARLAPFSDSPYDDVPFVSPDGGKLLFISARPLEPGGKADTERIWMMRREGVLWGDPQPLPPVVNQLPGIHHQVSTDAKGNLYFAAEGRNGHGQLDIYRAEMRSGVYQAPVNLGPVINGPAGDATPFVAPDGSYLLFTRYADNRSTVFVSFRRDGQWLAPIDLAKHIPYGGNDSMDCARVTPDGRYFLFTTWGERGTTAYWTDAAFLERLRSK